MAEGWQITWDVLRNTRNEAAVPVLAAAMDRAPQEVARRAMEVLLARRSPAGYWEFLLRWERWDSDWRRRLAAEGARFASAVRDALLSSDERIWRIGCDAVLSIREYDLVSVLLLAVEEREGWVSEMAADTVLGLCQKLREEEASAGGDGASGQRLDRLKAHALEALEHAADRFDRHRNRKVLEAFLLLADPQHPVMLDIIGNPHHPAFLAVLDLLKHTTRASLFDLPIAWLRAGCAPVSVLKLIAHRSDLPFLRTLLTAVGPNPSPTVTAAFRRLESIVWAKPPLAILDQLSDLQQTALVKLIAASGMDRTEAFGALEEVMLRGRTGGRRAAAEALADFGGAAANELVVRCLEDPDPIVQATLIRQLRSRSVPGCITRLVQALESPFPEVREAAQESLHEFTLAKFMTVIDLLEDDVKVSMGQLVRRVDPKGLEELRNELRSPARTRRLRAIDAACAMGAVAEVEVTLIDQLSREEDYLVRAALVRALGQSRSAIAQAAVRQALHDSHPTVRKEAQEALETTDVDEVVPSLGRLTTLVQEAGALLRDDDKPGALPPGPPTSTGSGT